MARKILIFDTTLRDGEQSPGCSMNTREKIEMAKQLEKLNVDIIEAGFAAASPGDLHAIQEVAKAVKGVSIASLARTLRSDIDASWEALKKAEAPRIHTFIATSPIHMEYKLKMKPAEVIDLAVEMVKYGKKYCNDIEFSAEDATRSDPDFLAELLEKVIQAGATTLNIPDTVGYTTPEEYYNFLIALKEKTPSIDKAIISAHCHNDLGLGVANTLAAAKAGAGQFECTINGIGERAGNAALEEIAMVLDTRKDQYDFTTEINLKEITRTSSLLTRITGVKVQPNKAIVGDNAFAHESGIHQHGVMNNKETYEIMKPETIGLTSNTMVLGKHSGKHAFNDKIKELGYDLSKEEANDAFVMFKNLADKKKQVYDKDIEALIDKESMQVPKTYELSKFVINSGNTITATSIITLIKDGKEIEKVSTGDGPIDASFKAIEKIIGRKLKLEDYQISSVTEGEDALGDALVVLGTEEKDFSGRGLSTDVVEASIKAYINAVNKIFYSEKE